MSTCGDSPVLRSRADRVETIALEGGGEIWLVEDRRNPIVSASIAWQGGASQDPIGRPGAAAMLSNLMMEGAGHLTGPAFRQALADDAIDLSFKIDRNALRGQMTTLSQHADRAFELLALAVTRAHLAPDDVDRVRDRQLAALRGDASNPRVVAARVFQRASFPDHPYSRPVSGEIASITAMEREDLIGLRSRLLRVDAFRLTVVGDFDAAAVIRSVEEMLSKLPAPTDLIPVTSVPFSGLGTRQVTEIDLPQSAICFGRPGISRDDPDFMAAVVVEHCLGSAGLTSRLFRELRENRGLCYSIGTQHVVYDHAAMLVGSLSTRNNRVLEALDVIRAEMACMASVELSASELADAQTYLTGSYDLRFDTTAGIAAYLLDLQCTGRTPDWLDRRNPAIEALTAVDTARAAARLCGDGSLLVTVAGRPVDP